MYSTINSCTTTRSARLLDFINKGCPGYVIRRLRGKASNKLWVLIVVDEYGIKNNGDFHSSWKQVAGSSMFYARIPFNIQLSKA